MADFDSLKNIWNVSTRVANNFCFLYWSIFFQIADAIENEFIIFLKLTAVKLFLSLLNYTLVYIQMKYK